MTNEAYERIVSRISAMSNEEYQRLLSQAKEMDNDFRSMFESFAHDITESGEFSSSTYKPAEEEIFSKVRDIDCDMIPSQPKRYVQIACDDHKESVLAGDWEWLAA